MSTKTKTYVFNTDADSAKYEARSVNEAVRMYMGTASTIRTLAAFKRYVEKAGGYATILEDGVPLIRIIG